MYRRVTGCFCHNIVRLHKVVRNGLVSQGFRWVWAAHHAKHVRKTVLGLYLLVTDGLSKLWLRPWQLWSAPWPAAVTSLMLTEKQQARFHHLPESIPSSNEVTTTYDSVFIYLRRLCIYGASLNCSDSRFPPSYEKLGTWGPRGFLISPRLSKPHAERVENRGIINVSCSKGWRRYNSSSQSYG